MRRSGTPHTVPVGCVAPRPRCGAVAACAHNDPAAHRSAHVARAAFEGASTRDEKKKNINIDAATSPAEPSVEEIMNPHPVLLRADMPIKEAVHVLLDADVSGAPVVDDEGRLVGVLSEKDIIWKGAGAPDDHFIIPPVFVGFAEAMLWLRDNAAFEAEAKKILAKTVAQAMAKERLVSVSPATLMSDAARTMLHHDFNLLPVTEGGKVVGVVTRHDVLRGLYASQSPFL